MKHVDLSPPGLIAVLNWLNQNTACKFEIETPWSKKPILSMELTKSTTGAILSLKARESDFYRAASIEEIDLLKIECAFFASGIVKPSEWTTLIEEVKEIAGRNLLRGDRPRRIVVDTVALNRRYYSVLERELSYMFGTRVPTGWGVGYLTTTGILRELAKYDRKYRPGRLDMFSQEITVDWFDWGSFTNQLMSKDRLFRLGDVEGKKMCNSGRCVRTSSRVGDDEIIKSIANHSRYNREEILTVSEDSDFVSKCKLYEINAIRLDRDQLPSGFINARWLETCDLLYVLAVTLGVIRVKWDDDWLLIQGIWRGKKEESWNQEHVRLSGTNRELMKWLIDFKAIAE